MTAPEARLLPRGTGRALALAQVALGLTTIVRARDLGDRAWLGLSPTAARRVVRVLGARQVAQGVVTAARGDDPQVLLVGSVVDALHAASMLPLVAVRGPYRRRAALSATLAAAAAAVGGAAAER